MGAELLCTDQYNDVHHTMVDTVCVYNGEPVYVQDSQGHRVRIQYLVDDFRVETVDYREKGFRYLAPALGYMNWTAGGQAIYLKRDIAGGRSHALTTAGIIANPVDFLQNNWWLKTKNLGDCIKGVYPSYSDAVKQTKDGFNSVAFHRHYAISRVRTRIALLGRDRQEIGAIRDDRIILLEARLKPIVEKIMQGSGVSVEAV